MTIVRSSALACELFKATRGRWMTRSELVCLLGVTVNTVPRWINEFVAQGILVSRTRGTQREGHGRAPEEFTLAPEWIGPGIAPPHLAADSAGASVGQGT